MAVASKDIVRSLQERVRTAIAARNPLVIRAGGTKDFYGHALALRTRCSIRDYAESSTTSRPSWLSPRAAARR